MKHSKEFKWHYDEEEGIFIRESEISINWLLSEVLKQDGLQITKISNEDLQRFLFLIDKSDLRMPDGKHGLLWLKDKIKEKYEMANAKLGETWAAITQRYKFILEQIDFTIINSENSKDKLKIKKDEKEKIYKTPNNMEARFEPK